MADFWTYNFKGSIERASVESFLKNAVARIEAKPDALPFDAKQGQLVIAWLRGRLDCKPSDDR